MSERIWSSVYFSIAVAVAALSLPVGAQVTPVDRASLEGSASTPYPLGRWNARLQQLHADLGAAARPLTGHAYRRDATNVRGSVPAFRTELEVRLSLSPLAPDQASRTFASNVGPNPTLVLPRTWVSFPATDRPADAPAPSFVLQIPYQTPYAFPAGGGVLCVDTTVFANDRPAGQDSNFSVEQDAHEVSVSGTNDQPGYRFGQGCPAPSSSTAAYASFTLRRRAGGTDLMVQSRYGMPSDATGQASTVLLFGFAETNVPWHLRPACARWTRIDSAFVLPGANDARGHWDGKLTSNGQLPTGTRFWIQAASVHPQNGTTLSDGSRMIVPPPGPATQTCARIAHGSDRASPVGTVSNVVPVTEFF